MAIETHIENGTSMTNGLSRQPGSVRHRASIATLILGIALGVYWVMLFYGTHTKIPPGTLPGNSDKYIHFGAYAILGMLLISFRATRGPFPWISVFRRWLILAMYGAFDELSQMFVKRSADIHDWYADITGAALGLGLVTFVIWRCRRTSLRQS
jgi:VanZ family protein